MNVYRDVAVRLETLGYIVVDCEDIAVHSAIDRAANRIKICTNRARVPDGLRQTWVDMAAGFFLFEQKAAGRLPPEMAALSAPAKSITEGDVTVELLGAADGALTPEARLDGLIDRLMNPPQEVFAAFRRFKW